MSKLDALANLLGSPEDVPAPVTSHGFPFPLGTVAPYTSYYALRLRGKGAYAVVTEAGIKPDSHRLGREIELSDGTIRQTADYLYWVNTPEGRATSKGAAEAMGLSFGGELVFSLSAKITDTLGMTAEQMSKWNSAEHVFDVSRGSFRPGDKRDAWHAVWLPSVVYAVARYEGFELPEELTESFGFHACTDRNVIGDGELYAKLFGGNDLFDGVYGQQRAALWKALGEENPAASSMIGTRVTVRGKEQEAPDATVSDKLNACFRFALCPWKGIYASIGIITAPSPNFQTRLPVCIAFLGDKATAETYVEELKAARGNGDDEAATVTNGKPTIPSGWATMDPNEWLSAFGTAWEGVKASPNAKKRADAIATAIKDLEITRPEFDAWVKHTEANV